MKKIALKTLVCIMAIFAFIFGVNLMSLPKTANAANFTSVTSQNSYFSMTMSARARQGTSSVLQEDTRTVTTYEGESITYNCFKWRELEYFTFRFIGYRPTDNVEIADYSFEVTFIQTEDLKTPIGGGKGPESEVLAQNTIYQNRFETFNFFYYIDSNKGHNSNNSHDGHDFGLYRFDFRYTYLDQDTMEEIGEKQWFAMDDPIYVAILPDDINNINLGRVSLSTMIIPGSELLNEFSFSLLTNNDALDYINPVYLEWEVTGKDTLNAQYCRDENMKNSDLDTYAPYKVIVPIYKEYHGKTFLLDTNGIEGTWTVACYLIRPTGKILLVQETNLSTIKAAKPSYIWIVYIVLGILLLIALIAVLIIIIRNRTQEKVW